MLSSMQWWVALLLLQEQRLQLPNGFEAILVSAEAETTVVALAFRAGVYDEPDGKQGLAHMTEHLFFRAGDDENAETMWNLTYFYAVVPPERVDAALRSFADRMERAAFTPEILERERPRVLQEIEFVAPRLEELKAFGRYPKAGVEADVQKLTLADVEAFRANHYRPGRALLVVMGNVEGLDIAGAFGKLEPRASARLVGGASNWSVVEYPCPNAAARVAAYVLHRKLEGRAYVEWRSPDRVRIALEGTDVTPLLEARDACYHPVSRADFGRARADATASARTRSAPTPPGAQAAINRLIFEIEGGRAFLDAAKPLTPDDVAAAALAHFRDPVPDAISGASPGPAPEPETPLTTWIAIGGSAGMILIALVVRTRKHLAGA